MVNYELHKRCERIVDLFGFDGYKKLNSFQTSARDFTTKDYLNKTICNFELPSRIQR